MRTKCVCVPRQMCDWVRRTCVIAVAVGADSELPCAGRWIPRREATGPKTIAQIRAEAKKEGIVMGDIPPPRGGPMMDPRGGPGMRGGMGGMDPRMRGDMRGGFPGMMGGPGGRPGMMDDRMGGRGDDRMRGGHMGHDDRRMGGPGNASRPGGMGPAGDFRGDRMGPPGMGGPGGGDARKGPGGAGGPGAQGPAAHAPPSEKSAEPAKPKLTVDQMEKRITSTLEEYVEIKEFNEVVETLKELPTKECYPFFSFKAVEMCCDVPKHKDCLVSLQLSTISDLFARALERTKRVCVACASCSCED